MPPSASKTSTPIALLFQLLFWGALVFAVYMALQPKPPAILGEVKDKYQHILAFSTLALLANFAFPRAHWSRIAERLSFLGALIEVLQSIPRLHRDCDILDWLADTAAVLVVLGVVSLVRRNRNAMRRRM